MGFSISSGAVRFQVRVKSGSGQLKSESRTMTVGKIYSGFLVERPASNGLTAVYIETKDDYGTKTFARFPLDNLSGLFGVGEVRVRVDRFIRNKKGKETVLSPVLSYLGPVENQSARNIASESKVAEAKPVITKKMPAVSDRNQFYGYGVSLSKNKKADSNLVHDWIRAAHDELIKHKYHNAEQLQREDYEFYEKIFILGRNLAHKIGRGDPFYGNELYQYLGLPVRPSFEGEKPAARKPKEQPNTSPTLWDLFRGRF